MISVFESPSVVRRSTYAMWPDPLRSVHLTCCESSLPRMAGRRRLITMARRRHTPEQIIRKLREADRLLGEGVDVAEVARHLEVSDRRITGGGTSSVA